MPRLLKVFFVGMLVSFLGSLPLGTLNIAAMQIAVSDGYFEAFWFCSATILVELIYVRISLVAMDKIRKQEKILKALEWVTLFIITALAISSFVAASHPNENAQNVMLSNSMHRFFLGLLMSAVNPVQIPFWFGWSTVLFTKKILIPKASFYNLYIAGIGFGSALGACVFIFGGKLLVEKLNANQNILNWVVGGIFTITALIQIWKIWRHKDAVQKIHDIKEEDLHPEQLAAEELSDGTLINNK